MSISSGGKPDVDALLNKRVPSAYLKPAPERSAHLRNPGLIVVDEVRMIPREPGKRSQLGFLFIPPYRVQGISIAGEQSVVQIPELDVCFDIGLCPRSALSSNYLALTHAHMDHVAALSYYFSHRYFQGMGVGTVVCHPALEQPIHNLMEAWVDLEAQRTPYNVIALPPDEQIQIKNQMFLRGFATDHTVPSLGFVVVEKRSKLKEEYTGLSQDELVDIKKKGVEITNTIEIPQICYTGDTAWGPHFMRDDVVNAKILITECTFVEAAHRSRAPIGKHLHLDHILALLERSNAEAIILTHLSRRTNMQTVHKMIRQAVPAKHRDRLFLLMDHRANRARYEQQKKEAEEA